MLRKAPAAIAFEAGTSVQKLNTNYVEAAHGDEVEQSLKTKALTKKNGRGDRIRTCDLFVPNEARYQAALHPAM